ncbi:MAG TPA: type II toxin-antitoxin system RelE/ParE family toxin [Clostridiaceae bacterium]
MLKLKYLPLSLNDLRNITDYIVYTIKAPKAAMDLINEFESSISQLQQFPYSCRTYQPIEKLETEYRMLPIRNYLVFYLVTDQNVEIHRIIFGKMDINKIIK